MTIRYVEPYGILETGVDGKVRDYHPLCELKLMLTHLERHFEVRGSDFSDEHFFSTSEWLVGNATYKRYSFAAFGKSPQQHLRVQIRLGSAEQAEFRHEQYMQTSLFGERETPSVFLVINVLEPIYHKILEILERSEFIEILITGPGMYRHEHSNGVDIRFLETGTVVADLPAGEVFTGRVTFLTIDFIKPFPRPLPEPPKKPPVPKIPFSQEIRPFLFQFGMLLLILLLWIYGMPKK